MLFSPAYLPPLQDTVTETVTSRIGFPQSIPGWPQEPLWLNFVLTVLLFSALSLIAYWLLFSLLRGLTYRSRRRSDDIFLNTVRTPLLVFLITFGVLRSLEVLELDRTLDNLLMTIFWVVVIATLFYLAWRIIREIILAWLRRHAKETETQVDDLLVPTINTLGPLLFTLAAVATIMSFLGIDVSLFLVSIGAVGLILGLAFQDSLSNLFSGVYLLLNPPFYENDIILMDGKMCTVQRVGLRMTQLYNLEQHSLMFVPNNKLAGETIINITKPTVDLAGSVPVKTTPEADPDRVKELLADMLGSHRYIVNTPAQKISTLRKRMEQLSTDTGPAGQQLRDVLADLQTWDAVTDERDAAVRHQLQLIRKQLSLQVDRAGEALGVLQASAQGQRELRNAIDELANALKQAPNDQSDATIGLDETRMARLSRSFDRMVEAVDPGSRGASGLDGARTRVDLAPLTMAMATIGDLDDRENQLEADLVKQQEQREAEFNLLAARLQAAARQLGTFLIEEGDFKGARWIELWADNLVIAYAEQELDYSLAGLDRELDELVTWLREVEAGGVDEAERQRIRALLGSWGGLDQLEKRRVQELRRRVLRWLSLKEEDKLTADEYANLVDAWERRLRTLSRRLRGGEGDEEELDAKLQALRAWLYSQEFREPPAPWKLPSPSFGGWGEAGLDFGLSYYIDDVRLNHYTRRAVVASNLRSEVYDVFKREGIEVPFPGRELWVHGTPQMVDGDGNGRVRVPGMSQTQPPVS